MANYLQQTFKFIDLLQVCRELNFPSQTFLFHHFNFRSTNNCQLPIIIEIILFKEYLLLNF